MSHMPVRHTASSLQGFHSTSTSLMSTCWERLRILFGDLGLVPKTAREEPETFDLTQLVKGISKKKL